MKPDQTLLLIDSHALIHRAYHAFPPTLTNSAGELTNAVYGFTGLLLDVLIKFKPSHVVAIFDSKGDTFRHDIYPAYKANRSSPDDELVSQIPRIEDLLEVFDIPTLRLSGYEADDIIGTIDHRHSGEWARTIIVTGDRDLFQLVDEDTFVYLAGSSFSKSKLFDAVGVEEKMGVGPEYILDIKSLEGDSSDNIPGVAGIGKKGALSLITEFGHLEEISRRIDELPNRYKEKLANNYEMAVLSKKLATIVTDVPIDFDFDSAPFGTYNIDEIREFFQEMEFMSLMRRLDKLEPPRKSQAVEDKSGQKSLFAEPEAPLPEWDGKELNSEVIGAILNVSKEEDPLNWQIKGLSAQSDNQSFRVSSEKLIEFMQVVGDRKVITDQGKELLHGLHNLGYDSKVNVFDVVVAGYILASGQTKQDLDGVLAWYKLGVASNDEQRLQKLVQLYKKEVEEMGENDKLSQLVELEQTLISVVVGMERNGIKLDRDKLTRDHDRLSEEIDKLADKIYEEVGHEFNVSSPKQVGETLFEERGLPGGKKTKTGAFSTNERILRELVGADPVVEMILDYRELTKLLSTYVKPLPQQVNAKTGRIHAEFNQLGAVTGRFSSSNPNMQNIPLGEVAGVNVRSSFVAREGSVFVAFDYSQQELRLLAELSGEGNMRKAFEEGLDVHALTASEIFGVGIDEVTKKQRQVGKTINFGVVYGMSAYGFSDRLKVKPSEAASFIDKYFAEYPKVQEYFDRIIEEAKENGYVETIMGRRRGTVALNSPNYQIRRATEREVMNFPLQGSAADIIKVAMNAVSEVVGDFPAKMILQVHDELIFEYETDLEIDKLVKDSGFKKFVEVIKGKMLETVELEVPLTVGVEVGKSWGGLEKI